MASCYSCLMDRNVLPAEIEEGNVEYKRVVDCNDSKRAVKLKSQLLWRLSEGKRKNNNYEAIYYVGIEDDGSISGLAIDELNNSIVKLNNLAVACKSEIASTSYVYSQYGVYAKILVRKIQIPDIKDDTKVGFLGCSESGKTTLVGVLTHDKVDNGNGSARSNIFRYSHEFENGQTSCIKQEIIGFSNSTLINYNSNFLSSWEYIVQKSDRIVSLIDMPGCNKYLSTTLFGIMAYRPDYIFIVVSPQDLDSIASSQDVEMYVKLCNDLNIQFTIILSKVDMIANNVSEYLEKIQKLANNILAVSSVTGENIATLKSLLSKLQSKQILIDDNPESVEFLINDSIFVPDVGVVVGGILKSGSIKTGDQLLLGPYNYSSVHSAKIVSIHKRQMPCTILYPGEIGSFIIKHDTNLKINKYKYMMLISKQLLCNFVNEFKIVLDNNDISKSIKVGTELVIFVGNVTETVTVKDITKNEHTVVFKDDSINYINNDDYVIFRYQSNILVGKTGTTKYSLDQIS